MEFDLKAFVEGYMQELLRGCVSLYYGVVNVQGEVKQHF